MEDVACPPTNAIEGDLLRHTHGANSLARLLASPPYSINPYAAVTGARMIGDMDGSDPHGLYNAALNELASKTIRDPGFAMSRPELLELQRGVRSFMHGLGRLEQAIRGFESLVRMKTQRGMMWLVEWLFKNDSDLRAAMDVRDMHVQCVPDAQPLHPTHAQLVRRDIEELRKDAAAFDEASKRLEAEANRLEEALLHAVPFAPCARDDASFRMYGLDLYKNPLTTTFVFPNQTVCIHIPAHMKLGFISENPMTVQDSELAGALADLKPMSAHVCGAKALVDITFTEDMRGETFYLVDATSIDMTRRLGGARITVCSDRQKRTIELGKKLAAFQPVASASAAKHPRLD